MKVITSSQFQSYYRTLEQFVQGFFFLFRISLVIISLEQIGGIILFIQIEPTSEIPIYTQLANQLIELIATGTLQPSEALPSVRSLAADLGVNMHTVNKAYHELERKNIIQIIPKSGAVINSISKAGPSMSQVDHIKQFMKPLLAESIVYGMDEEQILSITTSIISEIRGEKE